MKTTECAHLPVASRYSVSILRLSFSRHMKALVCGSFAVLLAAFFPVVSKADSVCDANNVCVSSTASSITVTEGATLMYPETITNNSNSPIVVSGASIGKFLTFPFAPDPSDAIASGNVDFGTCGPAGKSIAPGSSCSITVLFATDSDAGETDADSGSATVGDLGAEYVLGGQDFKNFGLTVDVTITDVPAPEPNSALLLAASLAGLMGIHFWQKRLA